MPIVTIVRRFPRVLRLARWLRAQTRSPVSGEYHELADDQVGPVLSGLRASWQSKDLPARQRRLVDKQIKEFGSGVPVPVFDTFIEAVQDLCGKSPGVSLLEIGCSSGYYQEVLRLAGLDLDYRGCDYSEALIALARKRYPNIPFDIEDATRLTYSDSSFDIVVSGCCVQHIPEFDRAIEEAARVSRSWVVFHRTPILLGAKTTYYTKKAYGINTFEIHFSEDELVERFRRSRLTVIRTIDLSEERLASGALKITRTYVCCIAP